MCQTQTNLHALIMQSATLLQRRIHATAQHNQPSKSRFRCEVLKKGSICQLDLYLALVAIPPTKEEGINLIMII